MLADARRLGLKEYEPYLLQYLDFARSGAATDNLDALGNSFSDEYPVRYESYWFSR